MKRRFNETIDGSIKNIIQLKTVNNSLEWSQMFDALEDTPSDFQNKLIDALNSIGQDKGIPPTDVFNTVLCKSDEKNEDTRKKLYNWWRGVFEVMSSISDMPKDRIQEYNEKVDALVAEILKVGSEESTEEEPVMESTKPRFKRGDYVVVRNGDDARVLGYYRDRVDKSIWYEVWIMDGNRTTEFPDEDVYASRKEYEAKYLYEEDYEQADKKDENEMMVDMQFAIQHLGTIAEKVQELLNFVNPWCKSNVNENFTKEVDMNRKENDNDEWVSMDSLVGVGESDLENEMDNGEAFWKAMDDVDDLERKGYWSGTFKVGDKVMWKDPEYDEWTDGWTVISGPEEGFDVYDDTYTIENDDGSEAEVLGCELRLADMVKEGGESEPMKKKTNEASVVVDADDVWEVLDLLSDEKAKKNLTNLINSHVRTEDEIMDAIDSYVYKTWGRSEFASVTKRELTKMFTIWMSEIVDELGLDVEKFKANGEFVDSDKPTFVELEGTDWKDLTETLSASELEDSLRGCDLTDLEVVDVDVNGEDDLFLTVKTSIDKKPEIVGKVNDALLYNVDNWEVGKVVSQSQDEEGNFVTELLLNRLDVVDEKTANEVKPDEVKDDPKTFKGDNGQKQELVTGEKKQFNEMTISMDVNSIEQLEKLLWGEGKVKLNYLLDAPCFKSEDGHEEILRCLEAYEIDSLTHLNDFIAYDFEELLEALGCDVDKWNDDLVIIKKGEGEPEEVDEAKEKEPKDPMIAKIEETIPVDAKDGLIEIRPDRFGSYLAVYAPGSEPEMVAATQALSKAFPNYYVGYDNNNVAIWPKKRV